MKSIAKITAGILLASVLLIGSCSALVSSSIDQVEKDDQNGAVTQAQIDRVKPGKTRASVERLLGKPDPSDVQTMTTSAGTDVTVYYPVKGGGLLDRWQINYGTDGVVESVNKF